MSTLLSQLIQVRNSRSLFFAKSCSTDLESSLMLLALNLESETKKQFLTRQMIHLHVFKKNVFLTKRKSLTGPVSKVPLATVNT